MPTAVRIEQVERIQRGAEAWRLAAAAYDALLHHLDDLEPDAWQAPTICEPWTVADMVRHVVGAAEGHASFRKGMSQQIRSSLRAARSDESQLDAWTALHVEERTNLDPDELVARLRDLAPAAVRGRARMPRLIGRVSMRLPAVGSLPAGSPARVTMEELNTVVYTRDTWLHRIDIARATDTRPRLDPDADGRIIEDVVVEWARRHGAPFRLTLDGPAGGVYEQGDGGPELHLDAVDFAWVLSGRADPDPDQPGADLLATRVLF